MRFLEPAVWSSNRWAPYIKKILQPLFHQTFQVPKMEVLNLIRLFWGWIFPFIGEYLHFRYLKCLVIVTFITWNCLRSSGKKYKKVLPNGGEFNGGLGWYNP